MNAAAAEPSSLVTVDLADPGEGLTEAEILEVKVSVGDRIEINAPVVEVETAKSAVELPSHVAGTVVEILVEVGEEVPVGTPLLRVDTSGGAAASADRDVPQTDADGGTPTAEGEAAAAEGEPATADAAEPDLPDVPAEGEDTQVAGDGTADGAEQGAGSEDRTAEEEPKNLVGYGERKGPAPRRRRRAVPAQPTVPQVPVDRILAKPPVRKLAKDLGIALHDVLATGPEGTVTREDVLAAQQRSITAGTAQEADGDYFPQESPQAPEGLDAAMGTPRDQALSGVHSDERTTRVPIRSVRRRTAEAMVASAFTAPHVTVFNEVDMTGVMEIVARLRASREWAEVRVSPLAVIAKALMVAIRRNPEVNASWDEDAQEIVYKHYVNLGIAAATPRGLIVPNLKDAHLMTLRELAEGITELARTARAGRTALRDTRDGTITITNYGVFDIDSGTPILNPGESAILGIGAIKQKPWVVDGQVVPRQVGTLSLSFDHRLIDGALGAELLRDVSAVLEDPSLGLVWG